MEVGGGVDSGLPLFPKKISDRSTQWSFVVLMHSIFEFKQSIQSAEARPEHVPKTQQHIAHTTRPKLYKEIYQNIY